MAASVRSSTQNGARIAGTTGLSINKPSGVVNGDILVAFIAAGDEAGGAYVCSGWTRASGTGSGAMATTVGNDIGTTVLFKLITDAGNEPSSYIFTNTDTAGRNRTGFIVCVQSGQLSDSNVDELTQQSGTNDWTPTHINITTGVDNCLCLFFHTGNVRTAAAKTAGAPATPEGTALIGSICESRTTRNYSESEAAYYQAGSAGAVTVGAWTGTPDDSASEWHVYSVSVAPLAAGEIVTLAGSLSSFVSIPDVPVKRMRGILGELSALVSLAATEKTLCKMADGVSTLATLSPVLAKITRKIVASFSSVVSLTSIAKTTRKIAGGCAASTNLATSDVGMRRIKRLCGKHYG